jgi:hypothetical protein
MYHLFFFNTFILFLEKGGLEPPVCALAESEKTLRAVTTIMTLVIDQLRAVSEGPAISRHPPDNRLFEAEIASMPII